MARRPKPVAPSSADPRPAAAAAMRAANEALQKTHADRTEAIAKWNERVRAAEAARAAARAAYAAAAERARDAIAAASPEARDRLAAVRDRRMALEVAIRGGRERAHLAEIDRITAAARVRRLAEDRRLLGPPGGYRPARADDAAAREALEELAEIEARLASAADAVAEAEDDLRGCERAVLEAERDAIDEGVALLGGAGETAAADGDEAALTGGDDGQPAPPANVA